MNFPYFKQTLLCSGLLIFTQLLMGQIEKMNTDLEAKLDSYFDNWKDPTKPGVAAGLIKDGKIIYLKGFGSADMENKIPITPDTKFQISFLSKEFTVFAVLLLEEQGKLSLKDDVRKFIPALPDFGETITLKHLLSQSSGLHDFDALKDIAGWRDKDVFTQADVIEFLKRQKALDYKPGTAFSRTATGLVLIAEVVAKASGQSFSTFTKEHIFEPLGMTNTEFCEDFEADIKGAAITYQPTRTGFKRNRINNGVYGSRNLYTSAADIGKWYLNFDNPKVGSRQLIKKLESPVTLDDGIPYKPGSGTLTYGQRYEQLERGIPQLWSFGFDGGYACHIFRFREQKITSFVLGNNSRFNNVPAMQMVYVTIGNVFLHPPIIDFSKVKTAKLSAKELVAHEGYYWDENRKQVHRIFVKNDTLMVGIMGWSSSVSKLIPVTKNKFQMMVPGDNEIFIKFSSKNGLNRMISTVGPSDPVIYEKFAHIEYLTNELRQFEGSYYCKSLNVGYSFKVKDGQLTANNLRKRAIRFTPVKEDLFLGSTWHFRSITFQRGHNEEITGFRLDMDGMKKIDFTKV